MKRSRHKLLAILTAIAVTLCALIPQQATSLPTVPDLNSISFGTLRIESSGSFTAPSEVINTLGYDPSQSWYEGESIAEFLTLDGFPGLALGGLTLSDIGQLTSFDLTKLPLSDFGLLSWQTISSVVSAIPELANYRIADIPPIADVLRVSGVGFAPENTIADILRERSLAALSLSAIDLSRYSLANLPGLETVPLEHFRNWERSTISQVPGLSGIPLGTLFNRSSTSTSVALVDIVFGSEEKNRIYTVSGSYQEGFDVPCERDCAHIELGEPFLGWQWISGKYQKVRGGFGVLAILNGGMEPTGRHPYGDDFKVVVWEVDEASGTAEQALFFRICYEYLGCTPYFIGPVPWFPIEEEGFTVL